MKTYLYGTDPNHDNQGELGKQLFGEVIESDTYRMRDFFRKNQQPVFNIIDIGANIGYFTLLASVLYPSAKKILVEPNPDNADVLEKNFADFRNIEIIPCALGTGKKVMMQYDPRWSGSDQVLETDNGYIDSIPFSALEKYTNTNYILKIDCEGGERYMKMVDPSVFQNCLYAVVEFHESEDNDLKSWEEWLVRAFPANNFVITRNMTGKDVIRNVGLYQYYMIRKYPMFDINTNI